MRLEKKGKVFQAEARVWAKARSTRWPELRPEGEVRPQQGSFQAMLIS